MFQYPAREKRMLYAKWLLVVIQFCLCLYLVLAITIYKYKSPANLRNNLAPVAMAVAMISIAAMSQMDVCFFRVAGVVSWLCIGLAFASGSAEDASCPELDELSVAKNCRLHTPDLTGASW